MQKDSFCERGADCGGYASGGVPVTGTLPELGQNGVPVCAAKPALHRHSDPLNVQRGVNVRPVECRYPARYRNSVRIECRFEAPKVALRRHSTGTTQSPHDLATMQKDSLSPVMQKDSFCERGADCGGYASGGVPVKNGVFSTIMCFLVLLADTRISQYRPVSSPYRSH